MANEETEQQDGSARIDPVIWWELANTAKHHSRPGSKMTVKSLVAEGWRLTKAKMQANGQFVATYLNTRDAKP